MTDAFFQPGEDVGFPFVVRDESGGILDIAGGTVLLEVWWRGRKRLDLGVGSGLTILDTSPATASEGEEQDPHGTALLTAAQTLAMPPGRIAKLRSRFVDSAAHIHLSPFVYLDDVVPVSTLAIQLGGRQGPAGAPILSVETFAAVPATGPSMPRLVLVDEDESNGGAPTLYLQDGAALSWLPTVEVTR